MAVIQQANSYKTVVGWYGDCSDEECQDINLSTFKPHITSVYQWDNSGVLKVWKSNLPDALNRAFKTLECGKLYYLYVKPGTGSFTIPNFVISSYETEDAGRIAALCQSTPTPVATPTPVPCDCASSDFVTLESTSSSAFVSSGHTFGGFDYFFAQQRATMAIAGFKLEKHEAKIIWNSSLDDKAKSNYKDMAERRKRKLMLNNAVKKRN